MSVYRSQSSSQLIEVTFQQQQQKWTDVDEICIVFDYVSSAVGCVKVQTVSLF